MPEETWLEDLAYVLSATVRLLLGIALLAWGWILLTVGMWMGLVDSRAGVAAIWVAEGAAFFLGPYALLRKRWLLVALALVLAAAPLIVP